MEEKLDHLWFIKLRYSSLSPEQTHLQFPPQATFTATNTVHDARDVLKMEPELLLNKRIGSESEI